MDGTSEVVGLLGRSSLLASVPEAELAAAAARCRLRRLDRGEEVFGPEERAVNAWLVVSGVVLVECAGDGEEPVVVDVIGNGGFFGALDGVPGDFYWARAVAITKATAVSVSISDLRRFERGHPAVACAVIDLLSRRLREAGWQRAVLRRPAPERLASILLWLRDKLGDEIPFSRRLIADLAMVARETAVRCLSPMEKNGWIRTRRGVLTMLAPRSLAALSRSHPPRGLAPACAAGRRVGAPGAARA